MALKYSKLSMFNVLGLYVNETMPIQNRSKQYKSRSYLGKLFMRIIQVFLTGSKYSWVVHCLRGSPH